MSPCLSRSAVLALSTLPLGGCGAAALELLLAKTPEFRLVAYEGDGNIELRARDYDKDDTKDDLCDAEDGESCHDDRFLGFAYYQCDEGAYGDFEQIGDPTGDSLLIDWDGDEGVAWRAAMIREEEEDSPRIDAVSTVADAPGKGN